jgi:hypothetical protein
LFVSFVSSNHALCLSYQQIINQLLDVLNQPKVLLPILINDFDFCLVCRSVWRDFCGTWIVFTVHNDFWLFVVFFCFILERNIALVIIPSVTVIRLVIFSVHHLFKVELPTLSEVLITSWGLWLDHRIVFEVICVPVC